MKKIIRTILITGAVISLSLVACKKEENNDQGGGNDPANQEIVDNAVIIPENTWENNILTVNKDDYTFTFKKEAGNLGLSVGDYMITSYMGGYLRKVTDIQTDAASVIISTSYASITDVIIKTKSSVESGIWPNLASDDLWLYDGVSLGNQKSGANTINLSFNTIFYDNDGDSTTTSDQAKLTGEYQLESDMKMEVEISNNQLDLLRLNYNNKNRKEVDCFIGANLDTQYERKVADIPCGYITVAAAIPIAIEPVLEVFIGFDADHFSSLETHMTEEVTNSTTITCSSGSWDYSNEISEEAESSVPSFSGDLDSKIYIKPEIKFRIYQELSSYLDYELYGEYDAANTSSGIDWSVDAGYNYYTGVDMNIWNNALSNWSQTMAEIKWNIGQGEYTYNHSIEGTWYRGDGLIVEIVDSVGAFVELGATWEPARNLVMVGDLKFDDIQKVNDSIWDCYQLWFLKDNNNIATEIRYGYATIIMEPGGASFSCEGYDPWYHNTYSAITYYKGTGTNLRGKIYTYSGGQIGN